MSVCVSVSVGVCVCVCVFMCVSPCVCEWTILNMCVGDRKDYEVDAKKVSTRITKLVMVVGVRSSFRTSSRTSDISVDLLLQSTANPDSLFSYGLRPWASGLWPIGLWPIASDLLWVPRDSLLKLQIFIFIYLHINEI